MLPGKPVDIYFAAIVGKNMPVKKLNHIVHLAVLREMAGAVQNIFH